MLVIRSRLTLSDFGSTLGLRTAVADRASRNQVEAAMRKLVWPSPALFLLALAVLLGVPGWLSGSGEALAQTAVVESACLESHGMATFTGDRGSKPGNQTVAVSRFYGVLQGQIRRDSTKTRSRVTWRWSRDSFLNAKMEIRKDKWQHFAASGVLYIGFRLFGGREGESAVAAASTGVLWEVKDAILPWEKYGFWGGDGFSWRDIVADVFGIATAVLICFAA